MEVTYRGTVRGNVIELDEPVELPEGTRVDVIVLPEDRPPKGSPQAVLQLLAGTLTHEEAEAIRQAIAEIRRADWEMWKEPEK
ncbi:MAG: hypothetical protein ABDI19_09225 [Armatimonadota bacterium]